MKNIHIWLHTPQNVSSLIKTQREGINLPNIDPLSASSEHVVENDDGDDETDQTAQEPIVILT